MVAWEKASVILKITVWSFNMMQVHNDLEALITLFIFKTASIAVPAEGNLIYQEFMNWICDFLKKRTGRQGRQRPLKKSILFEKK